MSTNDTPRLLVVEDEPALSQLVCTGLSKQGFETYPALTGKAALTLYHDVSPDAILLDVCLPDLDGFDVCREIRQTLGDSVTPIIMLTGADDFDSISRAFELGATDFLTKPINLPLLVQRIRFSLRNRDIERTLQQALYFQSRASQLARIGYWGFEYESQRFILNPLSTSLLQLQDREYSRQDILDLIHPEDRDRFNLMLTEQRETDIELRMNLPNVGQRIIRVSGSIDQTESLFMHGAFQDISEQRSTEDMLAYMRLHDDLTGLPNDQMLLQHLADQSYWHDELGRKPVLSKLSLSNYSRLVSVFSQTRLNTLIKQLAKEFRQYLRQIDSQAQWYYLGQGRFALFGFLSHPENVEKHLEALVGLAEKERTIEGEVIMPAVAISATLLTEAGVAPDVHYQHMRQALHQAETKPDKRFYWYKVSDLGADRQELALESEVKRALQLNRFDLYLQPQIAIKHGEHIFGFESLIRWIDEDGTVGRYSPDEFLPVVERLGLMPQLGEHIIRMAFAKALALRDTGVTFRIGINLAAPQFTDEQLVPFILSQLTQTQLDAENFEFEITETTAMVDPKATLTKLKALRDAGFHLAIDDFGIGHSSMEYLLQFPLTTLKIDRAFITDITTSRKVRAIVSSMVTLAKGLNMLTIAEGVESLQQNHYLDALGVDVLQGFYYSRALPLDKAITYALSFKNKSIT